MQITKKPINNKYPAIIIRKNDDFLGIPLIGETPSLRQQARVDITKEVKALEVALKVRGEIFGTLGKFSLVIGKAKSRITFLMTLIMAACFGFVKKTTLFVNAYIIDDVPPNKSCFVYVDTEKSEYHFIKVAKQVTRQVRRTISYDIYEVEAYLNRGMVNSPQ